MNRRATVEPQNQSQMDAYLEKGGVTLGPWTSHIWRTDPRHLCFLLSRYKFCAKVLAGKSSALEVGCGDAFGLHLVAQTVPAVHGIDFEPLVIEDARKRLAHEDTRERITLAVHDITAAPLPVKYDAAFSLDVLEHVPPEKEEPFLRNIALSLTEHALLVLGTPNVTAGRYATEFSRQGHVNMKSAQSLHELTAGCFHNVLDFSMNDEVVHTGYAPMAHYLLSIGVGPKVL